MQRMACSAESALFHALAYNQADIDKGILVLFTVEWLYLELDARSHLRCAQGAAREASPSTRQSSFPTFSLFPKLLVRATTSGNKVESP